MRQPIVATVDQRGVSRRGLLIGAGAAAAGGLVAFQQAGPDRVLRKLGLRESPDHRVPPAGAPVREAGFGSSFMHRRVAWAMAAPPEPEGVIVCLHGAGGDYLAAFRRMFIHDVVADQAVPLAVAAVQGGGRSYWHPRASGIDPLRMLHDELLPLLDTELGRVLPKALVGWSMGGYGALLAAERHRDRYVAAAAASAALWLEPGRSAPGAFDDAEDYRRHDVFAGIGALDGLPVRIDCGESDPFIEADRIFAARLPQPNLGRFSPGYHDARYWRSIAPAQVATIAEAIRG